MSQPMDAQPSRLPLDASTQNTSSPPGLNALDLLAGAHANMRVPLNVDVFPNYIKINSLDVNNPTFQSKRDGSQIDLNNVRGVGLDVTAFGSDKNLPVTQIGIDPGADGTTVHAGVQNPLSPATANVFGLPKTIDVPFTVSGNGLQAVPEPDLLMALSKEPGNTIPGMILSAGLKDSAQIAQFAQDNPQWFNSQVVPDLNSVKQWLVEQASSPVTVKAHQAANKSATKSDATTAKSNTAPQEVTQAAETPARITAPGDYNETMTIDGQKRNYVIHVPPNYNPSHPMPMLLALHGHGEDAADIEKLTQLNKEADAKGFIAVYPDAIQWFGHKDWSAWDTGNGLVPTGEHANDVGFLKDVIDKTQSQLSIDPSRIDMIGFSNGAMMTYLAASEMSDKIAAVAIVSGAMSGKEPVPAEPMSIISTHGDEDPIIPINGLKGPLPETLAAAGVPFFQSDQWATNFWKKADGITGDGTTSKDGAITSKTYTNPTTGAQVVQDTIANSGHIPDSNLGLTDKVWNFLEQHPKIKVKGTPPPEKLYTPKAYDINPLRGIQQLINKRGVAGTEDDINRLLLAAQTAPDGNFDPSSILNNIIDKAGYAMDPDVTNVLADINNVAKQGQHLTIDFKSPANVQVGDKLGPVTFENMTVGSAGPVTFDMGTTSDGNTQFTNLKGLDLGFKAFGMNLKSSLTKLAEQSNSDGSKTYVAMATNPEPGIVRALLFAPSQIKTDMTIDKNGNPQVDAESVRSQLLGHNPFVLGLVEQGTDVSRLVSKPSVSTALPVVKDFGLTAGSVYLGSRLGVPGAIAGLVLSPAVVHYTNDAIHKL